ncbi:hypothetical protein BC936DRAFT_141847 [Jimgerdemannia flammicorona]
MPYY